MRVTQRCLTIICIYQSYIGNYIIFEIYLDIQNIIKIIFLNFINYMHFLQNQSNKIICLGI